MTLYYIGWYVCVPYFLLSLSNLFYLKMKGKTLSEAAEIIERKYYWKGK